MSFKDCYIFVISIFEEVIGILGHCNHYVFVKERQTLTSHLVCLTNSRCNLCKYEVAQT